MSDTVTNAEIEDVLTSIRRLVSGDSKPAVKAKEAVSQPPSNAKLILTADFRVANEAPEAGGTPEDSVTFRHTDAEPEAGTKTDRVEKLASLESTIAELEAAISEQDEEWEPDGSGFEEDAEAVLTAPIQSVSEGEKTAVDVEDAEIVEDEDIDADDDEEDVLFSDDDLIIDKDILREMVGEIVRQELQGALGERITRNVRKLVRREINRILAAQDFD